MERTGSGGMLGRAGTVDNTCAAEVGKYIADVFQRAIVQRQRDF